MVACARNMQSDPAEIKPAQCCIKLVFHLTYTMMHGSTKLKFLDNPCSGGPAVPCSQMHRRKGMTKTIVAFRNFANALKNWLFAEICLAQWLLPWRDWVLRILLSVGLGKTKCRRRATDMDLKIRKKTKATSNWFLEPKLPNVLMWLDILCSISH